MAATVRMSELAARLGAPVGGGAAFGRRDRAIPVVPELADLIPEGGLVRGRIAGCSGPAAWSLAFALVATAAQAGAWVAVVGAPAVGLEAAAELGVPLDRVVVVDVEGGPSVWAERVAAAADGFEIVLTAPPTGAERVARRVRQRLQSNGVVLVAADLSSPSVACDLDLATADVEWLGIGQGWGRLMARRVDVVVAGRRMPRPVRRSLLLPGPDGRVALAERFDLSSDVDGGDGGDDGDDGDAALIALDRAG
jgi:hypothetical protein